MKLWILIADVSRARVFASAGRGHELDEGKGFVHPAGRQADRQNLTDRPGASADGPSGTGGDCHVTPH